MTIEEIEKGLKLKGYDVKESGSIFRNVKNKTEKLVYDVFSGEIHLGLFSKAFLERALNNEIKFKF